MDSRSNIAKTIVYNCQHRNKREKSIWKLILGLLSVYNLVTASDQSHMKKGITLKYTKTYHRVATS